MGRLPMQHAVEISDGPRKILCTAPTNQRLSTVESTLPLTLRQEASHSSALASRARHTITRWNGLEMGGLMTL